jgi:uncharacterized YccA/Bax inhibitor family protein
LHLGLLSIGMRSNPYGAAVAENPARLKLPMAMQDPRQKTGFAAAYAVGVLARAAAAGVESLALAMVGGPLGASGQLAEVIRSAAALAGRELRITETAGVIVIAADDRTLVANLNPDAVAAPAPGVAALGPESATVHMS